MTDNTREIKTGMDSATQKPIREARFELSRDVILSSKTRLQLDECLARLKFHHKIYQDWGFSEVDPMGMTAILNFYGPPVPARRYVPRPWPGSLVCPS
ncbi:hypothetical protein ACET4J_04630 [Pseudomonas aeruginosa]